MDEKRRMSAREIISTAALITAVIALSASVVFMSLNIKSLENAVQRMQVQQSQDPGSAHAGEEQPPPVADEGNVIPEILYDPLPQPRIAPGTVSMTDSSFGYAWLPALQGVEVSSLDPELFVMEDGFMTYASADVYQARGIDVSRYQEDVDWVKVKASNIDFAMIRLGFRGYGTGAVLIDENFEKNITGALAAGLDIGIYFFSQAISAEEALEEANVVLEQLEGYEITYPVVFDWEIIYEGTARTDDVLPVTLTDCAITFCERIKGAGYKPMIYSGKKLALMKYDLSRLADYDFWLAQYRSTPDFYYNFDMWQYTSSGTVDGIEGAVDLNICFKDYR